MEEVWVPVKGFEHYQVSSLGNVKSLKQMLKVQTLNNGYKCVTLYNNGVANWMALHILVCETFNGPKPFPTAQVLHKDDNKEHNYPSNLYWGTQKNNLDDQGKNGKYANAKLDWDKVTEMRLLYSQGVRHKELMALFQVSTAVVSNVINNKAWRI